MAEVPPSRRHPAFALDAAVAKRFPANPKHPERNCWGCDKYCAADALICGNGSERTQHPAELFGEDWAEWAAADDAPSAEVGADAAAQPVPAPEKVTG